MKSDMLVQETDGHEIGMLKMDISTKTTVGGWQGKGTTKENLYTAIVSTGIESHRIDTTKMNFPVKSEFGRLQRRTESEGNILSTITTEKDNRRLNIIKNSSPGKSRVESWYNDDDIVSALSQSSERARFEILKEKLGIHIDDLFTSAKSKWHKKGKSVDNLETSTKSSLEKLNRQGNSHENIYVTMNSTELRSESKGTKVVTETEQSREGGEDKIFIERVSDAKDSHTLDIMETKEPVKSNFGRLQRRAGSEGNLLSALTAEKDSPRFNIIKTTTRKSPVLENWLSDDDIVNSLSKKPERPRSGISKEKLGRWQEHGKHIGDMLTSAKSNLIKWHKKGKSVDNLVTPAKSLQENWNRQGTSHENIYVTMNSTELRSENKATKEVTETEQTGDDCKDRLSIAMTSDRRENHKSDIMKSNKPVNSKFGRLQRRSESEGNLLSALNSEKEPPRFNITKNYISDLTAVERWHSDDDIANALNKKPERPRFGILKEKLEKWHEHGKHIDDMLTSAKSNLVKWHNKGKSVDNLLSSAKSTLERWHRKGKSQDNIYVTTNSTEIKSKRKGKDAKKKAGPLKMFEEFSSDSDSSGSEYRDDSSVTCVGSYENLFGYKDITKCHYVETNDRRICSNPACSAVFTYKVHPHHCRRCGEVFCSSCLKLRRKLDRLAKPDPDGLSCKVCETCFREGTETEYITTRSLTEEFSKTRAMAKTEMNNLYCDIIMQRNNSSTIPAFWREQFEVDIVKESRRLLEGFSAAVCNSGKYIHKTIQELRKIVDVPAWQKSVFWTLEKMVTSCRICHTKFRKFHSQQKLRNCRVCGLALCKTCSNKELLVYFDDDTTQNETKRPRMAIIKYDGSPEVEPELSVLLYVCTDCKSEVLQRQLKDPEWFEEKPQPVDPLTTIVKFHDELTAVQKKILEWENEVNELTQDSERNIEAQYHPTPVAMATKTCDNTLQHGSELLNEIEAGLSEFHAYVFTLKEMRQSDSSKQLCRLLQNIIKGKCDFYWQHKQIFREQQLRIQSLRQA